MMTFRAAAPRVLGTGRHFLLGRSAAAAMGDSLWAPLSTSLQRSPHVALEEKVLLVERLLVAKVSRPRGESPCWRETLVEQQ